MADHRVEIITVEDVSDNRAHCVVRCLEGTVRVGEVLTVLELADGTRHDVSLTVAQIMRYGKPMTWFDPPHGALLELSGAAVGLLAERSCLVAPSSAD